MMDEQYKREMEEWQRLHPIHPEYGPVYTTADGPGVPPKPVEIEKAQREMLERMALAKDLPK
jgi:hypothetical protein